MFTSAFLICVVILLRHNVHKGGVGSVRTDPIGDCWVFVMVLVIIPEKIAMHAVLICRGFLTESEMKASDTTSEAHVGRASTAG